MIYLKTKNEIEIIHQAGQITTTAMLEVSKKIRPGIKTSELDNIAEEVIKKTRR